MENNEQVQYLELMPQPVFAVLDGTVVYANAGARARSIQPGDPISAILATGKEEYRAFQGGTLHLTLNLSSHICDASVQRIGKQDIFSLDPESGLGQMHTLALAARELRGPLSNIMAVADSFFPEACAAGDAQVLDHTSRINRGMFQLNRLVDNMADAYRHSIDAPVFEVRDITALLQEYFDQAQVLLQSRDLSLAFENLPQSVYTLVDEEKLERAIYNILSNAAKFTPPGGRIHAKLSLHGKMLQLTVQDDGEGISPQLRSSLFTQYQRAPALEESRRGIGLGMVFIRLAATAHGGTVLVEDPLEGGTRITVTMEVRQKGGKLRSPRIKPDYAGDRDHGLMELSAQLPSELFSPKRIN